jgi:hypothetical protein
MGSIDPEDPPQQYFLKLNSTDSKINLNLLGPVQEHFYDQVPSLGMVEEDKETPVNKPGALLQHLQGICKCVGINELSQLVQIFQGSVPVLYKDLRCQLSPQDVQIILQN